MRIKYRNVHSTLGFTLLELMIVVGLTVLLMSLLLPAVSGFTNTADRRVAVNTLMNTFEQARVAALESGQNVYVGFANDRLPSNKQEEYYAAFLVFRDATDEEKQSGSANYVLLKKWTRLPKNIAFMRRDDSLVPTSGGGLHISHQDLNHVLPASYQLSGDIPGIIFNNSGAIEGGSIPLQLFIYENKGASGLFEKITFFRYTGRCQLDITTPAIQ